MTDNIWRRGGKSLLLTYYDGSPSKAVQKVYSEHKWRSWKFKHVDIYTERKQGIKDFFEWFGNCHGFLTLDDWYKVRWEDIYKLGGLLNYPNNSPIDALQVSYPEHNWILSKFSLEKDYWTNNQMSFLDWLGDQLNCHSLADWSNITARDITRVAGQGAVHFCGSLSKLLHVAYPTHLLAKDTSASESLES